MPNPRHRVFWISAALVLKGALAAVFLWKFVPVHAPQLSVAGFWGQLANDSAGYLEPVEAFLRSGDPAELFGFRMYGYGLPYLLLRLVASQAVALNGLIVAQVVLSAISVYVLALTAYTLLGGTDRDEWAFVAVFVGYFLLPFVSHFDVVILTESFTTSTLIFSLYLLLRDGGRWDRALSGLFLGWGILLRPVLAPLTVLWLAFLLIRPGDAASLRARLGACAVLLLPLIALESTWVAGNRVYHHRWTFLNTSTWHPVFTDARLHALELIAFQQAYGGDWYDDWRWYYSADDRAPAPSIPYTSRFDADSIARLKQEMRSVQTDMITLAPAADPDARDATNARVREKLRAYTRSIREERPLTYHVVAPARMLRQILLASPTSRMFGAYAAMNRALVVPRAAVDLLGTVLLLMAVPAFVLVVREGRNADRRVLLLLLVLGYFVSVHALVFRMPDPRYLIPVVPLTLPIAVFAVGRLRAPGSSVAEHVPTPQLEDQEGP